MHCPQPRRHFLLRMLMGSGLAAFDSFTAKAQPGSALTAAASPLPPKAGQIFIKNGVPENAVEEAVLFPFDDCSLPFSRDLYMSLVTGRKFPDEVDNGLNIVMDPRQPDKAVLPQGNVGDPDS